MSTSVFETTEAQAGDSLAKCRRWLHRNLNQDAEKVGAGEGAEAAAGNPDPGATALDDELTAADTLDSLDCEPEQASRHPITRGIFAIPVLANHCPDLAHCAEGLTVAMGADGVTFEIAAETSRVPSTWVLGIEKDDGELGYFAASTREVKQRGIGLQVSAKFLFGADDPLDANSLAPVFDPAACQFRPRLSSATLEKWEQLGIIEREVVDCVLVCPRCSSVPTVRLGCRACGSIAVDADQLIHHFACAHVDLIEQFEFDNQIICPKCRADNLVVGADFEFVSGPFVCRDCQWSDTELERIGRCMACNHEFPLDHAAEKEVIGYHVDRLEPLDLVPAR